jgi:hypothetical protein
MGTRHLYWIHIGPSFAVWNVMNSVLQKAFLMWQSSLRFCLRKNLAKRELCQVDVHHLRRVLHLHPLHGPHCPPLSASSQVIFFLHFLHNIICIWKSYYVKSAPFNSFVGVLYSPLVYSRKFNLFHLIFLWCITELVGKISFHNFLLLDSSKK